MQLTLNSLTALRLIRAIRSRSLRASLTKRCDLLAPEFGDGSYLTAASLREQLAWLAPYADFSERRPLHVMCPTGSSRLRTKGVKSTCCSKGLPARAFVPLRNGIAIASPELVFIEMARVMEPIVHLLLGFELCGGFSRSPLDPHDGPVTYGVRPVTTVNKLRKFAQEAHGVRGARQALVTIDRLVDNAWSPMEALIAAMLVMPENELGYDLGPIELNPRKEVSEYLAPFTDASSRVPDIVFKGTHVGLNYDGADHFGLEQIARTAVEAERHPGDEHLVAEAEAAVREARARIVADKRRDRELEAMGYIVPAVTKEDLLVQGGLDKVVAQAMTAILKEGNRGLCMRAKSLGYARFAKFRQLLIWSLMPGPRAAEARQRLADVPRDKWPKIYYCEYKVNIMTGERIPII